MRRCTFLLPGILATLLALEKPAGSAGGWPEFVVDIPYGWQSSSMQNFPKGRYLFVVENWNSCRIGIYNIGSQKIPADRSREGRAEAVGVGICTEAPVNFMSRKPEAKIFEGNDGRLVIMAKLDGAQSTKLKVILMEIQISK